ncbi:MAG TPA: hypothetical protein VN230_00970 [Burkholderiaceae bacterium]|nr:hypothetical protein [Burkholderiaceae bacterium]
MRVLAVLDIIAAPFSGTIASLPGLSPSALLPGFECFLTLRQLQCSPLSLHGPEIAPVIDALLARHRSSPGRRWVLHTLFDFPLDDRWQYGVSRSFALAVEFFQTLKFSPALTHRGRTAY